jgi:hypothetical protein
MSCGLLVLVEQTAEAFTSSDAVDVDARSCGQRSQWCSVVERSMWPVPTKRSAMALARGACTDVLMTVMSARRGRHRRLCRIGRRDRG